MDDLADLDDRFLEHAVRRRIGDHQCSEVARVRLGLGAEIGDIDVSTLVGSDDDDFHSSHHRASRIGAVRGLRNQTDLAVGVAARAMVRIDHEQSRVLAL